MTYITGNLQNQKIPCALSTMSIAGIEAEVKKQMLYQLWQWQYPVSTTVIIALGIVLMQPLTPVLNSAVLARHLVMSFLQYLVLSWTVAFKRIQGFSCFSCSLFIRNTSIKN